MSDKLQRRKPILHELSNDKKNELLLKLAFENVKKLSKEQQMRVAEILSQKQRLRPRNKL
ncbi:hypothetical protein BpHYR1_030071 [Brachionus plicatilis]|uniref:Uncharacterized protein n=1 Tax=Brachionus plicatilis TaxID=10195 RepID=A0A3M7SYM9_BRAPC|nr:hypothetical protein BpHYR1_030071 [Brachionus plicatilis]